MYIKRSVVITVSNECNVVDIVDYTYVVVIMKNVLWIKGKRIKVSVNACWYVFWSAGILRKGSMYEMVTPGENNISAVTEQVFSEPNFQKLCKMSLPIEEGVNEDFPPLGQRKGKRIYITSSLCETPIPSDLIVVYVGKQRYKRYGE
jgi:hypothetical protein